MTRDTFVRAVALAALATILLVALAGYETAAVVVYIGVASIGTAYALAEDAGTAWGQARRARWR